MCFYNPERFKKYRSHSGRGFLVFWRGFGEGAGLKNPVTDRNEAKTQKDRRLISFWPNGYSIF